MVHVQMLTRFLWLSLPVLSKLIRNENGAFVKTLFKLEEFENAGFAFLVWILKMELC